MGLSKLMPKRNDYLKHIAGGAYFCIGFVVVAFACGLGIYAKEYLKPLEIAYFALFTIASAGYEIWQKVTGKGEYNWIDWCFGMIAPTITITLLLIVFSIFS